MTTRATQRKVCAKWLEATANRCGQMRNLWGCLVIASRTCKRQAMTQTNHNSSVVCFQHHIFVFQIRALCHNFFTTPDLT